MPARVERLVTIDAGQARIEGMLELPPLVRGIVLFAHGSGSSRHSPRNNAVARVLRDQGIGTLLIDLLTPQEDVGYQTRFDIGLLTTRLQTATRWLQGEEGQLETGITLHDFPVGYFGASTGAAAALRAAAQPGARIAAVVSRGGRPDLAGPQELVRVRCPTLLLVGGRDPVVLELNRTACAALTCHKELSVIDGASHLFEEPGALEEVARQAAAWFAKYCKTPDGMP